MNVLWNKQSNDLCVKRTSNSIILCPSMYNFLHSEMFKNTSIVYPVGMIQNLLMHTWAEWTNTLHMYSSKNVINCSVDIVKPHVFNHHLKLNLASKWMIILDFVFREIRLGKSLLSIFGVPASIKKHIHWLWRECSVVSTSFTSRGPGIPEHPCGDSDSSITLV